MRIFLPVVLLLVLGCRPLPPEPRDMNTLDMEGRTWIDPLTGEPFTGPYESYYENGDVYERGMFREGRFEGPFETFYDNGQLYSCLLYTSPSPRDKRQSRMPSSA